MFMTLQRTIYPTVQTTYNYRLFGTIDNTPVNLTFTLVLLVVENQRVQIIRQLKYLRESKYTSKIYFAWEVNHRKGLFARNMSYFLFTI